MKPSIGLFLGVIFVGCGGSTTDGDPAVTDAGADGTADTAKGDTSSTDTAITSGDALLGGDTRDTALSPDGDCATACVLNDVAWGDQGGRVAYLETSTLTKCQKYGHKKTPTGTDPPERTCSQEITPCGPVHQGAEVNAALDDADVKAAFAKAPTLYGLDTRPTDGSVLVITVGGKEVSVGLDCGGTSSCTPIPPGLAKLVTLLRAIDTDQLGTGTCKTTFGP